MPAVRLQIAVPLFLAEGILLAAGLLVGQPFLGALVATCAAFGLVAYWHPDLAWGIVWFLFPFSVERLLPGGIALHIPTEPLILSALLAWTFRILAREPLRLPRSPLHAPLMALAAVVLASSLLGPYPVLGLRAWAAAAMYVLFGYVYLIATWRGPGRAERLYPWIVGSAAVWGIFGSLRVLADGASLRSAYHAARPFFAEHGAYGAYLAMILPLAILLTVERRGQSRVLYGAAATLIAVGILLSFTRASWVGIAVVLPLLAALWALGRRSLAPVAWLGGLAAVAVVTLVVMGASESISRHVETIGEATDVSNLERVNRWMAAVEMAKSRPLLGVGYAAYPIVYHEYRRKILLTELAYQRMGPHSELFRLLSENGILGVLAAGWLMIACIRVGVRASRDAPDPGTRLLALAVLAGLGTWWIHGLFRTYIDLEKVAVPFWASLGVLAAVGAARDQASRPSPP